MRKCEPFNVKHGNGTVFNVEVEQWDDRGWVYRCCGVTQGWPEFVEILKVPPDASCEQAKAAVTAEIEYIWKFEARHAGGWN
jgi:hypothetical protein